MPPSSFARNTAASLNTPDIVITMVMPQSRWRSSENPEPVADAGRSAPQCARRTGQGSLWSRSAPWNWPTCPKHQEDSPRPPGTSGSHNGLPGVAFGNTGRSRATGKRSRPDDGPLALTHALNTKIKPHPGRSGNHGRNTTRDTLHCHPTQSRSRRTAPAPLLAVTDRPPLQNATPLLSMRNPLLTTPAPSPRRSTSDLARADKKTL
mgnify:CR=1 FL=1